MTPDHFSDYKKTPEHKERLAASLRRFYANGGAPWNKGKHNVQKPHVWTKAEKAAQSKKFQGRKCPWLSEANRKYKRGQTLSPEQRKKISVSMKRARRSYAPIWNKGLTKADHPSIVKLSKTLSINTRGKPRPYKSSKQGIRRFWFYSPTLRVKMRSRWEVAYAHYLDSIGEPWLYEYCIFIMDDCSYAPDFYLTRLSRFDEVKGWMDERSRKKIDKLAKHFGCSIRIVGPKRMESLGLIDRHGRVIYAA